jgi:hypothetical protein
MSRVGLPASPRVSMWQQWVPAAGAAAYWEEGKRSHGAHRRAIALAPSPPDSHARVPALPRMWLLRRRCTRAYPPRRGSRAGRRDRCRKMELSLLEHLVVLDGGDDRRGRICANLRPLERLSKGSAVVVLANVMSICPATTPCTAGPAPRSCVSQRRDAV